jgi:hypothetical protein
VVAAATWFGVAPKQSPIVSESGGAGCIAKGKFATARTPSLPQVWHETRALPGE